MAVLKHLVPALALASYAAAASCSVAATTTIQNQGDASALASCTTFSGSIALATGTTDNIALDGIEEITGDLVANNVTNMGSLSGAQLQTIGGTFLLESVTVLTSLTFPALEEVDSIMWTALPNLPGLSFTRGVQMATNVRIENTNLYSLDGINLQRVDSFFIANNNFLSEISMQLGSVRTALTLQSNGRNVSASFPNLEYAFNLTFRNVSSLSIPSLASVNSSCGFFSNDVSSINAPNLTSVGGTLSFVSNSNLANVSMPKLQRISGGFTVANNTKYDEISFPSVTNVGGALDYYGNFTSVDLPKINVVSGAFNLQSSEDISDICDHFQPLSGPNNVIRGTYTCAGEQSTPQGQGSTPTGSGVSAGGDGSASGSGTPSGAAVPSIFPATYTTGVLGVIAAIFGVL